MGNCYYFHTYILKKAIWIKNEIVPEHRSYMPNFSPERIVMSTLRVCNRNADRPLVIMVLAGGGIICYFYDHSKSHE